MRRLNLIGLCLTLILLAGTAQLSRSQTTPKKNQRTFVGNVTDSMCGLKHMMPGVSDKECTLECVKKGSKLALADTANGKVYELSDQDKAKDFAGQKVKVEGTLKSNTIEVASIQAAQ